MDPNVLRMNVKEGENGQRNRIYLRAGLARAAEPQIQAMTKNSKFWTKSTVKQFFAGHPTTNYQIKIPSLLYLGQTKDHNETRQYFKTSGRKQVGCHAFIESGGTLTGINCYWQILKRDYCATKPSSINAIYPNVTLDGKLDLGLRFMANDPNNGDRHFHRDGFTKLNKGGVYELSEEYLHNMPEILGNESNLNEPRFAIYVCAGAKLIVSDKCVDSIHHNRIFLQPGSIVIAEAQLAFRQPLVNGTIKGEPKYQFNDFAQVGQLFEGGVNIDNPVIFLGAVESEYNSIAWFLHFRKTGIDEKIGYIGIPEGGRIEAIEKWDDGIREIYARHRYERLFEHTLSPPQSKLNFAASDQKMMRNILGLNPRSMNYNPTTPLEYQQIENRESPLQLYNFQSVYIEENNDEDLCQRPYSVPPLYPPICQKWEPFEVQYIPTIGAFKNWNYPDFRYDSLKSMTFNGEKYAIFDGEKIPEYKWVRANENFQDGPVDGINYRVGIDFDVYKKAAKVGLLRSRVYSQEERVPDSWEQLC